MIMASKADMQRVADELERQAYQLEQEAERLPDDDALQEWALRSASRG